jgi:quercetin dioxygenase-like cupin family protein
MAETVAIAKHSKWNDIEIENLNPLIGRQMLVGTNLMVARVLFKKGGKVPMHSHHNEQVTYILEGALQFFIDNREITVRAGEVLCIPPNMPHEAVALEDTVDLDIFNPPRQDWIDKDDAYLRQSVNK